SPTSASAAPTPTATRSSKRRWPSCAPSAASNPAAGLYLREGEAGEVRRDAAGRGAVQQPEGAGPAAGAGGGDLGGPGAAEGKGHRRRLLGARDHQPDLGGRADRAQRQGQPDRWRFWAATDRDDRPV